MTLYLEIVSKSRTNKIFVFPSFGSLKQKKYDDGIFIDDGDIVFSKICQPNFWDF